MEGSILIIKFVLSFIILVLIVSIIYRLYNLIKSIIKIKKESSIKIYHIGKIKTLEDLDASIKDWKKGKLRRCIVLDKRYEKDYKGVKYFDGEKRSG